MTDGSNSSASETPETRLAALLALEGGPAIMEFRDDLDECLRGVEGEVFVVFSFDAPVGAVSTERRLLAIPHTSTGELVTPSLIVAVRVDIFDAGPVRSRGINDDPPTAYDSPRLVAALEAEGLEQFGPVEGDVLIGAWTDLVNSLMQRRAAEIPADLRRVFEERPPLEPRLSRHRLAWLTRPETYRAGNTAFRLDMRGGVTVTFLGDEITRGGDSPVLGFRIADVLARHLARLYARRLGPVVVWHEQTRVSGRSDLFGA